MVERVGERTGVVNRRSNNVARWFLGTWQSDRRRSLRHYKTATKKTPPRHRKFRAIFGKLKIRWTRRRCYVEFLESKTWYQYEIVASDDTSLVVRMREAGDEPGTLQQIHFEGPDIYWVGCAGILCEYFKRIG